MSKVEHVSISVQDDFLARQTRAQPVAALAELIWNSLDGDANEVGVEFERADLAGGLSKIVECVDVRRLENRGAGGVLVCHGFDGGAANTGTRRY